MLITCEIRLYLTARVIEQSRQEPDGQADEHQAKHKPHTVISPSQPFHSVTPWGLCSTLEPQEEKDKAEKYEEVRGPQPYPARGIWGGGKGRDCVSSWQLTKT